MRKVSFLIVCNLLLWNMVAFAQDDDVSKGGFDHNNLNPYVYPMATEICDGIDNDGDGVIDEGVKTTFYRDADGDGYGVTDNTISSCTAPIGYVSISGDSDDSNNTIYPGVTEIPGDGIDQDGDGSELCYKDSDNDGYRPDATSTVVSADCDCIDSGEATAAEPTYDCDDSDPAICPSVMEICDGKDNDCDGTVDEGVKTTFYQDADGDGHGNINITISACTAPDGYVSVSDDCDDSNNTIYPGATEICDGKDNDCDESIDELLPTATYYQDTDGDGFGNTNISITTCSAPVGYVEMNGDCNDNDETVYPGAPEGCDDIDRNCDGITHKSKMNSISVSACESYTAPDGIVYNTSGIKTAIIPNASGCDSTITIDLTINSVDIAVTQVSNTLTADVTSAAYQWLDCSNNYQVVPGERNQEFSATSNGHYAVEITWNGCIDTSSCYQVNPVNIADDSFEKNILVYPNPTDGLIFVDLGKNFHKIQVIITDVNGRVVKRLDFRNRQFLEVNLNEPYGNYFMTILSENQKATIRLIKN